MSTIARLKASRYVSIGAAAAGALLLAWSLRTFGTANVINNVRRLGAGFIVIVALGGLRHLVRSIAWRLCFDDPATLSIGDSVAAYISGDAIGNVTPFGIFASEPSKIVLVRRRAGATTTIPALALENAFYGLSVVAMLGTGTIALLIAFDVTRTMRAASLVVLGGGVAGVIALYALARWRPQSTQPLTHFVARHRDRLWAIGALEAAYHAAAVLEIWIALRLITGVTPTLLTAFVLECVNRTITIVFQFVPMWLGVDEVGTGTVAAVLGIGGPVGVALAIARKARVAIWTAVGLALLGIFRARAGLTTSEHAGGYRRRERIPRTST